MKQISVVFFSKVWNLDPTSIKQIICNSVTIVWTRKTYGLYIAIHFLFSIFICGFSISHSYNLFSFCTLPMLLWLLRMFIYMIDLNILCMLLILCLYLLNHQSFFFCIYFVIFYLSLFKIVIFKQATKAHRVK